MLGVNFYAIVIGYTKNIGFVGDSLLVVNFWTTVKVTTKAVVSWAVLL